MMFLLLLKRETKKTQLVLLGGFYVHKINLFRGHYVRELKIFPSYYYLKF